MDYPGRDLEAMSLAHNYHAWIVAELRPYAGRRLIEVGAGCGNLTRLLLASGVQQIAALEPSTQMFPHLVRQTALLQGVVAQNCVLATSGHAGSAAWDSVAYINVLEHIANDSAELGTAWSALRPGGALLIFVPALHFLYSAFDRSIGHLRRYHRVELETRVEDAGFEVVHSRYFDMPGILPWYITMVLLGGTLSPRAVALYDRLVVPLARAVEGRINPPLGKNLLLVGRKPLHRESGLE